jgi:hypothetical protein
VASADVRQADQRRPADGAAPNKGSPMANQVRPVPDEPDATPYAHGRAKRADGTMPPGDDESSSAQRPEGPANASPPVAVAVSITVPPVITATVAIPVAVPSVIAVTVTIPVTVPAVIAVAVTIPVGVPAVIAVAISDHHHEAPAPPHDGPSVAAIVTIPRVQLLGGKAQHQAGHRHPHQPVS